MSKAGLFTAGVYLSAAAIFFHSNAMGASIAPGQANTAGTVVVTGTTVMLFNTAGNVAHIFDNGAGSGSFTGLTAPDSITDLSGGPVTGPISVVNFATFTSGAGLIHFDLTNIDPGFGTLAGCATDDVGNVCTPSGSPFTIEQVTANKVAFTLSIEGIAYTDVSTTGASNAGALFTGQQVPGTISQVLSAVGTANGFSNTYSATFSAGIPEPGTLAMFLTGAGMLGVSAFRRRALH